MKRCRPVGTSFLVWSALFILAFGYLANALAARVSGRVAAPGQTIVTVTNPLLDDFETPDGRSQRGSLWMNATDAGAHPTRMVFGRELRETGNHALQVFAKMSESEHPFARVWLALARGDLQPADVSHFSGVQFDARGEGTYRVALPARAVRDGRYHHATFTGSPAWMPVTVPFATLKQSGTGPAVAWSGRDVLEIGFDIDREPGAVGWLEIDNLRLYQ